MRRGKVALVRGAPEPFDRARLAARPGFPGQMEVPDKMLGGRVAFVGKLLQLLLRERLACGSLLCELRDARFVLSAQRLAAQPERDGEQRPRDCAHAG